MSMLEVAALEADKLKPELVRAERGGPKVLHRSPGSIQRPRRQRDPNRPVDSE